MARRFTRRRWRRPERLTLEHPPVVRRKDIAVPDLLTLEPELAQRENRRRSLALYSTFLVLFAVEVLAVAYFVRHWLVAVGVGVAVLFLAAEQRFADRWIRHAIGAHHVRAPRLDRVVAKTAELAGIRPPEVFVVRGRSPNVVSFGQRHSWIAVTTATLDLDDLPLEGMLAHEIVHLRDGDTALASRFVFLAGAPDLALRGLGARAAVLAWLGLPLWPVSIAVRLLRRWWLDDGREHRADIAAALLTRYPPGVEEALRGAGEEASSRLGLAARLWFAPRDPERANRVAEM